MRPLRKWAEREFSESLRENPRNKDFLKEKRDARYASLEEVGREGIEPPTQGFSVLCSTD